MCHEHLRLDRRHPHARGISRAETLMVGDRLDNDIERLSPKWGFSGIVLFGLARWGGFVETADGKQAEVASSGVWTRLMARLPPC
jgi:hypothetical protein